MAGLLSLGKKKAALWRTWMQVISNQRCEYAEGVGARRESGFQTHRRPSGCWSPCWENCGKMLPWLGRVLNMRPGQGSTRFLTLTPPTPCAAAALPPAGSLQCVLLRKFSICCLWRRDTQRNGFRAPWLGSLWVRDGIGATTCLDSFVVTLEPQGGC